MQKSKRLTAVLLSALTATGSLAAVGSFEAGATGTGAGLAEWALNAYYSGWSYQWGGCTPGAVDCSGLIYSYCGGERIAMIETCTEQGSVSAGIPNVHGLGLWRPGHVGVYIENNMEVDARGDDYGVCYQAIGENGWNNWTYWFKLAAVTYPTSGWEEFNGNYYYYENGEYIVNTSRTIDGKTYYFDSLGHSGDTPSDTSSGSGSSSGSDSSDDSGSSQTPAESASSEETTPTSWRNGSSGKEVEKIQARLKELGYYDGPVDGEFGNATEQAYRAFQQAAGLLVDGIAGSDRDVLYSDDAPYASTDEEAKEEEAAEPATEAEEADEDEKDEEEAPASYQSGDESEEVSNIQSQLAQLGYFDIEPTGYFGDYTYDAVAAFQKANGIEVTGTVDEATYELLFSGDAVANPEPEEVEDLIGTTIAETGPVQLSNKVEPEALILQNETNQSYADTASELVTKTNEAAEQALSKSTAALTSVKTGKVQRTASVGLWFAVVAVILAVLGSVSYIRSRKRGNYARYAAKKKKRSTKAQLMERW